MESWITNGIKTSIKIRDKVHKQMIKQKDAILKNQNKCSVKDIAAKLLTSYKSQRKLIIKDIPKKTGKTLEPYGVVPMKLYILRKAVKQSLHHLSQ